MKYKVLLTGKNHLVIDDFFGQMEDVFESVTTSSRYMDIVRHMQYFDPDVFVYCIYNDNTDVYANLAKAKSQLYKYRVPFVLVGSKEDCDEFERMTVNVADFKLLKPLTAEAIADKIESIVRKWNAERNKPAVRTTPFLVQAEKKQIPIPEQEEEGTLMQMLNPNGEPRKHILIVDDSPIMLKTLKESLRDNYDVATAVSGKVAMKFLERKKTDLILLDYEMPEENGPVVLEKLRSNADTKNIPVIFLTGVTDSGKIREALVLKPQGYLLKPINYDKLMEAIVKTIG